MVKKNDKLEIEVSPEGGKISVAGEGAGQLSQALADLISPFTEGAGYLGDKVRVYRQKTAIKAMKEVRDIARQQEIDLKPVPLKILIPWLEKASLEETDSPLIEWWANLLVSATDPNFETKPYFTDLVSKITPDEALLLERLWQEGKYAVNENVVGSPQSSISLFLRNDFEQASQRAIEKVQDATNHEFHDKYEPLLQHEVANFRREWEARGIVFRGIRLHLRSGKTITASNLKENEWISLQVCKGLQLLEDFYFEYDPPAVGLADRTYSVTATFFTDLGVKFMLATHRDTKDI